MPGKRTTASLYNILAAMLILMAASMGCRKQQPVNPGLPSHEAYDMAYGADSLQRFDLFLPEGHDEHTAVILLIHGGGWISGDKWSCENYAKQFAARGFAAISMNYRLAGSTVHYPEMIDDIRSMIQCILKNARLWSIGNSGIALFGYSAGGHLALLYGYSADTQRDVTSIISVAGPADIQDTLLWKSPGILDDIRLMTGDSVPENWSKANPLFFSSRENPATLLIHGTKDEVVPVTQSYKMDQALEKSNIPVKLVLLENETHTFSAGAFEKIVVETTVFVDMNIPVAR